MDGLVDESDGFDYNVSDGGQIRVGLFLFPWGPFRFVKKEGLIPNVVGEGEFIWRFVCVFCCFGLQVRYGPVYGWAAHEEMINSLRSAMA